MGSGSGARTLVVSRTVTEGSMGWIVVEFPERREVFVSGNSHGFNYTPTGQICALQVGDGLQTIRLGGDPTFEPPSQDIEVPATSNPIQPFRVVFTKRV
jgi:hypothetical protein